MYSRTAMRRGIDNSPNKDQMINMEVVADEVFEPLRSWVGGPIKINNIVKDKP